MKKVLTYTTTKGRITIPSAVCRQMGITAHTRMLMSIDMQGQKIILKPITRAYIHSLRGKYKGRHLIDVLTAEKAKERAHDMADKVA